MSRRGIEDPRTTDVCTGGSVASAEHLRVAGTLRVPFFLVLKLCLGTHAGKLRFPSCADQINIYGARASGEPVCAVT